VDTSVVKGCLNPARPKPATQKGVCLGPCVILIVNIVKFGELGNEGINVDGSVFIPSPLTEFAFQITR
jgi:hypothetical protein